MLPGGALFEVVLGGVERREVHDIESRRIQIGIHLSLLFERGCEEEGFYFSIFSLPSGKSRFFDKITRTVVDYALSQCDDEHQDVYVGMGMFRDKPLYGRRGEEREIVAIQAIFSDIDVRRPNDSKPYPETFDNALKIAPIGPHAPSFHSISGGGIHTYHVLKELLIFNSSAERNAAKRLLTRVNSTHQAKAREHGWVIDSIRDLSRVLRLAGTKNYKRKDEGVVVDVVLVVPEDLSTIEEFEETDFVDYLVDSTYADTNDAKRSTNYHPSVSYVDVNPEAAIPSEKLHAAFEAEPDLEALFNLDRKEFKRDTSKYDLAIANILVSAEWSDQDITDAIIHFRREYARDPKMSGKKPRGVDYYQRTIGKAREVRERERSEDKLESGVLIDDATPVSGDKSLVSGAAHDAIRQNLRAVLGANIIDLIQNGLDDAHYTLVTHVDGVETSIPIGSIKDLFKFETFEMRLWERHKVNVNPISKDMWRSVKRHFSEICHVVRDPGNDTRIDRMRRLIFEYSETHGAQDIVGNSELKERCAASESPFYEGERLYVAWRPLLRWLRDNRSDLARGDVPAKTYFTSASIRNKAIDVFYRDDSEKYRYRRYWVFDVADFRFILNGRPTTEDNDTQCD